LKFSKYFQDKKKKGTEDDIEANVSQASKPMLGGVIRQIRGYASIHKKGSNFLRPFYMLEPTRIVLECTSF